MLNDNAMRIGIRGFGAVALLGIALVPACFAGKTSNVGAEDPEGSGGAPNCTTGDTRTPTEEEGFCNTCFCVDGDWECSTNACPNCESGAMRPADDGCNTCTCSPDGYWMCTNRECTDTCTPGLTRPTRDGCNTCTCDEDGESWFCTAADCPMCQPGQMRYIDACNLCTCTEDNAWACDDMDCPVCEPGTQIPAGDGCNTCACTAEGTRGECTALACPSTTCRLGEQRPAGDGCNTCTCMEGSQGLTWACTMRLCTCEPGTTIPSLDGCNFCTCNENGEFDDCTDRTCGTCEASPTREACVPEPRYAFDPATLTCCFYNDACDAPASWMQYTSFAECMNFDPPCAQGYADCNALQEDGCETNVDVAVTDCGRCGFECPTPINGTAFCATGGCNIVCDAGWMNCNMRTDDGCETAGTDCSAF